MNAALGAAVPPAEEAAELFASLAEAAAGGEGPPDPFELADAARAELAGAPPPGAPPEALAAARTLALLVKNEDSYSFVHEHAR
eukprot:985129-Prorocentrum_minimum.AAC.1